MYHIHDAAGCLFLHTWEWISHSQSRSQGVDLVGDDYSPLHQWTAWLIETLGFANEWLKTKGSMLYHP